MEPAGTIIATPAVTDPDAFAECDGGFVDGFRFADYRTRCGGQAGAAGIGLYRRPIAAGYSIRLVDDPALPDPPPDRFSIDNLPPAGVLVIEPVADVESSEAFVTVTATGIIMPAAATLEATIEATDGSWNDLADAVLGDESFTLTADGVPVPGTYRFTVALEDRPSVRAVSNDFAVTAPAAP